MPDKSNCPVCGAPMPPDSPGGHCPRCLLALAAGGLPASAGKPRESSPARFGGKPPRFFGDYELLGEIARGGMGVVYRARQLSLNRLVAVKMILEGPLAVPGFIERFQLEAEAAAKLSHPNIVPIYEIGEYDGRHFFSMKLFEGGHLGGQATRCPPPNQDQGATASHQRQVEIAQLLRMVAEGVHHAHQRGILHRDLKPANILMDDEGRPHVADFGLAKLMGDNSLLTQTGALSGTPAYMAPEQAAGESAPLTTATDIYSLGAILYQLLTGQPPFHAPTAVQTLRKVVESEAVPPHRANSSVDQRLSTICLKCLQKEPARRYTSARALAEDLQRWQNGETIFALPSTGTENFLRWCRRNPAIAVLSALVILSLVAVAVISTSEAFHIKRARDSLAAAEKDAKGKLWNSLLAQARAERWSGRPGQRFDGLAAINSAAAIRKSTALRNEAIACLCLTDIRLLPNTPATSNRDERLYVDWAHQQYAWSAPDGSISIRRWEDRSEVMRLPSLGRIDFVKGMSPDGRWLGVSYTEDKVSIIDLQKHAEPLILSNASFVCFSPNNAEAVVDVGSNSFTIVKLDGSGSSHAYPLPNNVGCADWSPDGSKIAFAGENYVCVVDSASHALIRKFDLATGCVEAVWNPDGIHIAATGADKKIRIFDVTDGSQLPPLAGHLGSVTSVAFHPGGNILASAGWDGFMRLWDWRRGKEIIRIAAGAEAIFFSPDGRFIANYGRAETMLNIFELVENQSVVTLNDLPRNGAGDAALFDSANPWFATSIDDTTTFWNPRDGKLLGRAENLQAGWLQNLPGKRSVLAWANGFYLLEPQFDGSALKLAAPVPFQITAPNAIKKWLPNGFKSEVLRQATSRLGCSASGKTTALVAGSRCFVIDLTSNALKAVTDLQPYMKFVAVSPDDRWIATGAWNTPNARVWDAATGKEVTTLPTANSPNVAFTPDGRWLVTSTGREYRFWNVKDWTPTHGITRPGMDDLPGVMAFSSDGRLMALAYSRSVIRLVEPATGNILAQLEPVPGNDIIALAFNADASELAVTRVDAPPQIWHLRHLQEQLATMSLAW